MWSQLHVGRWSGKKRDRGKKICSFLIFVSIWWMVLNALDLHWQKVSDMILRCYQGNKAIFSTTHTHECMHERGHSLPHNHDKGTTSCWRRCCTALLAEPRSLSEKCADWICGQILVTCLLQTAILTMFKDVIVHSPYSTMALVVSLGGIEGSYRHSSINRPAAIYRPMPRCDAWERLFAKWMTWVYVPAMASPYSGFSYLFDLHKPNKTVKK